MPKVTAGARWGCVENQCPLTDSGSGPSPKPATPLHPVPPAQRVPLHPDCLLGCVLLQHLSGELRPLRGSSSSPGDGATAGGWAGGALAQGLKSSLCTSHQALGWMEGTPFPNSSASGDVPVLATALRSACSFLPPSSHSTRHCALRTRQRQSVRAVGLVCTGRDRVCRSSRPLPPTGEVRGFPPGVSEEGGHHSWRLLLRSGGQRERPAKGLPGWGVCPEFSANLTGPWGRGSLRAAVAVRAGGRAADGPASGRVL